ncbi:MAG TPA: ABC transporter permease [Candidatus Merdivicinus excrementipullorum]|uniref:Cell division protein FtsX n=1 Tax=Candidatus Merdivicinus excrementipullorum TaxID=2840867 RepID=A0A9D1FM04_9FIRM|nr:ABC transporter permease [Candidatus Merdivicinus excrementipullorum]
MRASSFRYLVKTGVHNLWANRMMTVASVGTLIACLLIVGFAVLFSINVDSIVEYLGQQNEVVVFMQMDTPAEYMATMEAELNSMEGLDEVVYVSSEEGFAEYKEGLGEDSYLLDGMEAEAAEILPAKFTAKIVDPQQVDAILASIRRMDYVDTAEAPTDLTKTLVSVRTMVNTIGGIVIAALVLVSLVIITNTIRASVFTRRKEISIMKYVGATNGFIRVPFIVEGVLLGIIAAVIAFLGIWGGYTIFVDAFATETSSWLGSITQNLVPFWDMGYQLLGYFLLAGILTGGVGSAFSMRGHLKV